MEITPLDASQARRFLQVARADRFEALYVHSLTVGLRMGEALGLKWSGMDLDAGKLRVNRQLQRICEGGGLVFSEPKNASRRTVELPQRAVVAFRNHRKIR
jgi:integrase